MNGKIVFALCCFFCSSLLYAEICPSINALKQHTIVGWKAYDSIEDKPLSKERSADFIKNATQFVLAEWTNDHNKAGTIHCYYRDNDGSNLEAYLSKENFLPQNTNQAWYQVTGSMQCAAGADKCAFFKNHLRQELARK